MLGPRIGLASLIRSALCSLSHRLAQAGSGLESADTEGEGAAVVPTGSVPPPSSCKVMGNLELLSGEHEVA